MSTKAGRAFYVYILTNGVSGLYVDITNDFVRRVYQHKRKPVPGFTAKYTAKYNVTWLAYYEQTTDVRSAIQRERQIKSWRRIKKVALIESFNPQWQDLSLEWYDGCGEQF